MQLLNKGTDVLRKAHSWFSGLSKAGKIGVILATLFVAGAAANPSTPQSNNKPQDTDQTAQEERQLEVETKTVTETEEIPFKKTSKNDDSLAKGRTTVQVKGVNGERTLTYEIKLEDGREVSKKLLKDEVTTDPVNEVTLVGTYVYTPPKPKPSNCDPNYSPCVPNVTYDLDCPDIGFSVTVIGSDPHGFDGNDNDGYGCESY